MGRRRVVRTGVTLLLASMSIGVLAPPAAAAGNPRTIFIESISAAGSGCPSDSFDVSFSDDRTQATIEFDSFKATSGEDIATSEHSKSCQLGVDLHAPRGVAISLGSFAYTGSIDLPSSVTGTQSSTYTLNGTPFNNRMSRVGGPEISGTTESSSYSNASGSGTITDLGFIPLFETACATRPLDIDAAVSLSGPDDAEAEIEVEKLVINLAPWILGAVC